MRVRFLLLLLLLYSAPLMAQPYEPSAVETQEPVAESQVYTLKPVVVRASSLEAGQTVIGGADLEMLPSATGSITEALKGMSQIQYDDARQSSLTVGEIAPPRISISGAKPYENNFMIDGTSVSNTFNPSGLDNTALHTNLSVGGADTNIFYDVSLLESIDIYSSNISARYGGFVGGVVNSHLRHPAMDRWRGSISGRYTEDSLFDMRDVEEDSDSPEQQPRFAIYSTAFTAEGPLSDKASLLLSYSRRHSTIPLKRERPDGTVSDDKQWRLNQSFFSRLLLLPQDDLKLTLDLTYAPYEEYRWRRLWPAQSEYRITNNSWRLGTTAKYYLTTGVLTAKASYAESGFSRKSASNISINYRDMIDSSHNYRSGGVGDAIVDNYETLASVHFKSDDFYSDNVIWNLHTGVDFAYRHTDKWNEQAGIINLTLREHLPEPADDRTYRLVCHDQENLARAGTITALCYDEYNQSQHMGSIGGFAETEIAWKRLLLRPGFRGDYDNFSGNLDVAPRFKAEVDTFDNGLFRIFFGANRYYGQQLRAYAFNQYRFLRSYTFSLPLDEAQVDTPQQTNQVAFDRNSRTYSSDKLDTPYSDELSAGFIGGTGSISYSVELLQRRHKKQLVSQREDNVYYMTNNGRSRYEAINLALSTTMSTESLGQHKITVGATRSKTTSSFALDSFFADINTTDPLYDYRGVFYNGTYQARSDLPAGNYSSPWVLTLGTSSTLLNDHIRLYSLTRWRGTSKGLIQDTRRSADTPHGVDSTAASNRWFTEDGRIVTAYKSGKISGGSTTDITAEFDAIKTERYHLTLILEVLNIFNGNMQTGVDSEAMGTGDIHGRGFYLGARMTF